MRSTDASQGGGVVKSIATEQANIFLLIGGDEHEHLVNQRTKTDLHALSLLATDLLGLLVGSKGLVGLLSEPAGNGHTAGLPKVSIGGRGGLLGSLRLEGSLGGDVYFSNVVNGGKDVRLICRDKRVGFFGMRPIAVDCSVGGEKDAFVLFIDPKQRKAQRPAEANTMTAFQPRQAK